MDVTGRTVSVIGAGLMGTAVARTLHRSGQNVTVWSRTEARTRPLLKQGLSTAAIATAAIEAAEVCILLITNFEAARPILNAAQTSIAGRTVVNLMTGSERDTRACAELVASAGGRYVDGAIVAYPSQIGSPRAVVLYCGDEGAWTDYGPLLMQLGGGSRWLGSDPGLATVLDTAATGAFFQTSLAAFVEAASYAVARGLSVATLSDLIVEQLEGFKGTIAEASEAIRTRNWETRDATLDTYSAATHLWCEEMQRAGVAAPLISASLQTLRSAQRAGYGSRSFYAQFLTPELRREDTEI